MYTTQHPFITLLTTLIAILIRVIVDKFDLKKQRLKMSILTSKVCVSKSLPHYTALRIKQV